jgi:hypothetical protein
MRKTVLAAVLAVAATAVSACGGGGGEQGTSGSPPPRQPAAEGAKVPEGVATQYATIEEEVGAEGGEKNVGEWRVAYIVEPAEGWFERQGDDFEFRPPADDETHHIEILPFEAKTGRLVPNVPIRLEVLDAQGEEVASDELSPYYGEFFHYAGNFAVPEAGEYTLKATIEPPEFLRHGEEGEEPALAEGAEVEFENVRLEAEQG